MEIKVARFELYPKEEPTAYAIGFDISFNNAQRFYRDTSIALTDTIDKDMDEIVGMAWDKLKDSIIQESEAKITKPEILGKRWNPPSKDLPENLRSAMGLIEEPPGKDDPAGKDDPGDNGDEELRD